MSSNNNIYIQEYSVKSFVVRGDTQKYKETLKNLGGKWGSNFTDKNTGEKFGAWLFWSSKKEEIENWIKSGLKFKECNSTKTVYNKSDDRLKRLEDATFDIIEVINTISGSENCKKLKNTDFYNMYKKQNESKYDIDDLDDDEEIMKPHKRLL